MAVEQQVAQVGQLVAHVALEVAQVELEVCFDLEEVEDPGDVRIPIQEVDEQ